MLKQCKDIDYFSFTLSSGDFQRQAALAHAIPVMLARRILLSQPMPWSPFLYDAQRPQSSFRFRHNILDTPRLRCKTKIFDNLAEIMLIF